MRRLSLTGFIAGFIFALASTQPAAADYQKAVALYYQGQYDKAIQELKPDLDRNPSWETGHRILGLCYLGLKNNALAVSELARAVELKSTSFATYMGLGRAYFNMQKYDSCISALNQGEPFAAKEKEPDKEKALLCKVRGSAYFQLGKFDEAANDLTSAIRVNQSDWTDFYRLGVSYLKLNRIDEAIQTLEKALSMKSGDAKTTGLLADAYLQKGNSALSGKQYAAAMQYLLKAKDYDPKNGYVYYNLAEAYLFQKKYPDAEKALTQAADLMPQNVQVFWRTGLVYEKQKKWPQALTAYQKAEQIKSSKEIKDAIARVKEDMKK
ncbi:MAG TPA: tetratricopeptide repeat protein [Acidobacteriota bacterium]|nr:tetratricopeptide repeat protein [Acidobacteriota bacterium]